MSETITRERLNEIVNQLATVILGALDAAPCRWGRLLGVRNGYR